MSYNCRRPHWLPLLLTTNNYLKLSWSQSPIRACLITGVQSIFLNLQLIYYYIRKLELNLSLPHTHTITSQTHTQWHAQISQKLLYGFNTCSLPQCTNWFMQNKKCVLLHHAVFTTLWKTVHSFRFSHRKRGLRCHITSSSSSSLLSTHPPDWPNYCTDPSPSSSSPHPCYKHAHFFRMLHIIRTASVMIEKLPLKSHLDTSITVCVCVICSALTCASRQIVWCERGSVCPSLSPSEHL